MSSASPDIDPAWPPGTVRLEDLSESQVILEPKPSRDPNDPLNWPQWRKNLNFGLVSYSVVMVMALINVTTVTWGPLNLELGFSFALLNDSYAAGCGALAIGGVILVPFALKFGRRPVYVLSTAFQCGISIWQARMQNVADLMLVNILSCIVGALSEVMVQMTVADVYFVHERGLMNTIYYWFMTVGTSLAPLAGGYITSSQGWRWVWWWMAILFGGGLLAFVFLYEETMFNGPVIDGVAVNTEAATRQHSSKERSKGPGPNGIDAAKLETAPYESVEIDQSIPTKRYWQKLALWTSSSLPFSQVMKHTYQPFLIMFSIPAVFYMALEYGIMTACTTVPVTTLSSVMTLPPYNFGSSQIGLMGLAPFTGGCLSAILCGPLSDKIIMYLAKRKRGIFEPEMRLWLCLVFVPCVPAGLFMFGIGLNDGAHWLLPAFGLGLTSFGVVPASSAALTYLTDAYTDIIADSIVAVTFTRNVISTIFVFALQPWVDRVGLKWFYVTFGLITLLVMMGNLVFIYFGKSFRVMSAGRYGRFARQLSI